MLRPFQENDCQGQKRYIVSLSLWIFFLFIYNDSPVGPWTSATSPLARTRGWDSTPRLRPPSPVLLFCPQKRPLPTTQRPSLAALFSSLGLHQGPLGPARPAVARTRGCPKVEARRRGPFQRPGPRAPRHQRFNSPISV